MKSKIENRKSKIWLVLGLWLLGALSSAQACVGCREPGAETIANERQTVLAGMAFSWSVLVMLGIVFLVVGGMATYIWQTCRRIERERSGS